MLVDAITSNYRNDKAGEKCDQNRKERNSQPAMHLLPYYTTATALGRTGVECRVPIPTERVPVNLGAARRKDLLAMRLQHPLRDDSFEDCSGPKEKAQALQELRGVPMLALSVRMLHYWGLLYDRNWRGRLALTAIGAFNLSQFVYMATADVAMGVLIRNAYMLVLWFNALLRGWLLTWQRDRFVRFLWEFLALYKEILHSENAHVLALLGKINKMASTSVIGNLVLGLLMVCGFCVYPIFSEEHMLPYGSHVPGIDELARPNYELAYVYQVIITPIGCLMFMAYGNLVVSFIMLAILMCRVLEHRLRSLPANDEQSGYLLSEQLNWCIKYQKTIIRYVHTLDQLTAYVFLVEFIAAGILLCGLLFLVNMAETTALFTIAVIQISTIFSQIFTLYWFTNELAEAGFLVAAAAYDTAWFDFPLPLQRHVQLLIMRSQITCSLTVGRVYPMSLEVFQTLLNASYTYFTLLRRVYV